MLIFILRDVSLWFIFQDKLTFILFFYSSANKRFLAVGEHGEQTYETSQNLAFDLCSLFWV